MALRLRSMVTFCGAAAILSGTGLAGAGGHVDFTGARAPRVTGARRAQRTAVCWPSSPPVGRNRFAFRFGQASSTPFWLQRLRVGTPIASASLARLTPKSGGTGHERLSIVVGFWTGTAGAAGLVMLGGLGAPARAAGPLTVGVLIPGSKSDKGWMESGYDGREGGREEARRQDRRQVHREREVRRHGAGAGEAGRQERSGDRRRRPDPGVGLQGGAALPQGEIRDRRRQRRSQEARQRRGLRRAPGRDRLRRRRGGRHAVQDRRRVLCRRPRDPGDQERRHRVRQRRASSSIPRSSISRAIPATSTTSPRPRKRPWPRSRRAPTSTTTSSISACAAWNRRRARRARTSSAAIPIAAAPIRSTSPTRSPASASRSSTPSSRSWPAPGSPSSSRSAWRWVRNPPT